METVSIRDLRGESLRHIARQGKPVAVTNHRVLVGVVIPVSTDWVEHLLDHNWSGVQQNVATGEQALASGQPLATIDSLAAGTRPAGAGQDLDSATLAGLAAPVAAAIVGGDLLQTPQSEEAIRALQAVLNPARPGDSADPANSPEPTVRTVRIGDLTALRIERAAAAGQALAITHDRELIGILIPVTQDLVEFLIEQAVARARYSIRLGEKQLGTGDKLVTLDQVTRRGDAAEGS